MKNPNLRRYLVYYTKEPSIKNATPPKRHTFSLAKITVLLLMLFAFVEVKATHILGGELSYTFLSSTASSNTYRIRLTLYRDCAGITLVNGMTVRILNANNNQSMANVNLIRQGTAIDRSNVCAGQQSRCVNPNSTIPGVEEHIYEGNYTVSNLQNFPIQVAFFLCCRPNGVTNLFKPGPTQNQGIYLSTIIPAQNANLDNNSPVFLNPPNGVFCQGQAASLSLNAFDPDGDALVYSLVPARGKYMLKVTNDKYEYYNSILLQ